MADKQEPPNNTETIQFLLEEFGTELRSRRVAEHAYIGASVAAYGGIIWGVSSLTTAHNSAAYVAAVGCVALAIAVTAKVWKEHQVYLEIRPIQQKLAVKLAVNASFNPQFLGGLADANKNKGRGFVYALAIQWVAAIMTSAYCFLVARCR